jgi:hypothetical protein
MASPRFNLRRGLAVCFMIVAGFGGLFSLALLGGALTGEGFVGSMLLLGSGTLLLALSVAAFVIGLKYWRSPNQG